MCFYARITGIAYTWKSVVNPLGKHKLIDFSRSQMHEDVPLGKEFACGYSVHPSAIFFAQNDELYCYIG